VMTRSRRLAVGFWRISSDWSRTSPGIPSPPTQEKEPRGAQPATAPEQEPVMQSNQTPVNPNDSTRWDGLHRPPRDDERGPCPHCGTTMGRPVLNIGRASPRPTIPARCAAKTPARRKRRSTSTPSGLVWSACGECAERHAPALFFQSERTWMLEPGVCPRRGGRQSPRRAPPTDRVMTSRRTILAKAACCDSNAPAAVHATHHLEGLRRHLVEIGRPVEAVAVANVLDMLIPSNARQRAGRLVP
jgi:hypothetical protein